MGKPFFGTPGSLSSKLDKFLLARYSMDGMRKTCLIPCILVLLPKELQVFEKLKGNRQGEKGLGQADE